MREYVRFPRALAPERTEALRQAALGSRFVSRSPLVGSFRASRGFAAIFTRGGRARLEARMPFLAAFLDEALSPARTAKLLRLSDRLRRRPLPSPNAFYLNLLLLEEGASVGRHVDATLREPSGVARAVPAWVSVLYLECPEGARGGRLRLFRGERPVAELTPEPGLLVQFRGDLHHEVEAYSGGAPGGLRASLVLEQYAFEDEALGRLPSLRIQSKAGFAAYLENHRHRSH